MKKAILGILLGLTVLCHPVISEAHERNCPTTIELTQEEADELMRIAWCEAGNQGPDGQLYVMSVILNRVSSPNWPGDIHSVIYEPFQFATSGMKTAQPSAETHQALAALEMGNVIPEIIAFEKKSSNVLDKYFTEAFDYRDHKFYTVKIN